MACRQVGKQPVKDQTINSQDCSEIQPPYTKAVFYLPLKMVCRCVFCVTCCLLIGLWLGFLFVLNFRRLIGFGVLLILDFICLEGL